MRAKNDDVNLLRLGGGQNGLRGIALPDHERGSSASAASTSHQNLCPGLDARPFLINAPQESASGKSKEAVVDDAEHHKLRTGLGGEANGRDGGVL